MIKKKLVRKVYKYAGLCIGLSMFLVRGALATVGQNSGGFCQFSVKKQVFSKTRQLLLSEYTTLVKLQVNSCFERPKEKDTFILFY